MLYAQGTVPTNRTGRDIIKQQDENQWHTGEVIALLAGLAGLFHDFGKANLLFQNKLRHKSQLSYEPYRHEWISLRLFQAYVNARADREWLEDLAEVSPESESQLLHALENLQDSPDRPIANPFADWGSIARAVGWLIVSHHRLPQFFKHQSADFIVQSPAISQLLLDNCPHFNASWNSPQCLKSGWLPEHWSAVWQYPQGTPMRSQIWCHKARQIAQRALRCHGLWQTDRGWMQDRFTVHLARLSLMLADHSYSSAPAEIKWQDNTYAAYANTDRTTRLLKQKLDEHNSAVAHHALLLAKCLPHIRRYLPALPRHHANFKKRTTVAQFRWQDRAFELAQELAAQSHQQGFFGVNMASTGCGKTFANARIMYGLAGEKRGCRFSVALGLRTLTLQTGDALRQRLRLESDDLAVLIGSAAVQQLHETHQQAEQAKQKNSSGSGSESDQALIDDTQYVRYEGSLAEGPFNRWLKQSDKVNQLISAPILVSTIDHLISATEGTRGGRQIAPMLRLLTSDLVLDEPDDFDIADLPALCRLVNWAGMLGSRVLLSSATLPPSLICALFDAYQRGRAYFNRACTEPGSSDAVCCAWFDEFGCQSQLITDKALFKTTHNQFVAQRIKQLSAPSVKVLRRGKLLPVTAASQQPRDVVTAFAEVCYQGMQTLHQQYPQRHSGGKCISIGLIRMANIEPLVAVSQQLLAMAPPADTRIHFCIYHSQHPMLVRSTMEAGLDQALMRDSENPEALWQVPAIERALKQPERQHIFLVIATAVVEVGRDHDYDWMIAEPSSMRSLIQLAGRLQRHRKKEVTAANLFILNQNYKALCGKKPAYWRPGFESDTYALNKHTLEGILEPDQFQIITANPRIVEAERLQPRNRLVDLEHWHLICKLFDPQQKEPYHAALWWQHPVDWCAELQRNSRFRKTSPDEPFTLYQEELTEPALFHRLDEGGLGVEVEQSDFVRPEVTLAERVEPWFDNQIEPLVAQWAARLQQEISQISLRYNEIRLRVRESDSQEKWHYHPLFGVYGRVED